MSQAMTQKSKQLALVIDLNVCVGCHACVTSCKEWNTSGSAGSLPDFICAAAPPGGGRNAVSLRFTRHFNLFCVPESSKGQLGKIFGNILQGFLKTGFQDVI